MTKKTFDIINQMKNGVDVRNGIVYRLDNKPKKATMRNGRLMTSVQYREGDKPKTRQVELALIIAVRGGLFDRVKNPTQYEVCYLDGDVENCKLANLFVQEISENREMYCEF